MVNSLSIIVKIEQTTHLIQRSGETVNKSIVLMIIQHQFEDVT